MSAFGVRESVTVRFTRREGSLWTVAIIGVLSPL